MGAVHTAAHFESTAFNTTEPREYFINDCCFGDDVGRWLIARLQAAGVDVDPEPGQEDFGWFINYRAGGEAFCFVFGWVPDEHWWDVIERDCGLLAAFFGGRRRGIGDAGIAPIRNALSDAPEITNVVWEPAR